MKIGLTILLLMGMSLLVRAGIDLQGYTIFTVPTSINKDSTPAYFTISVNKKFAIKIRGNPTTGYQVFLANDDKVTQSNIVKALNLTDKGTSKDYVTDPHPEHMMGVPGNYYFTFLAEQVGQVKLKFENKRAWDTSDSTSLEVTINVVAGDL